MAVWNRGNKEKSDDDSVSLTDDDHAWWAGREHLQKAFVPKTRSDDTSPAETTRYSAFEDKYSSESLFNWADGPEPDDPTHGGQGTLLDPYTVIGLQPGATLDKVVNAHRSLAKRYHPDRQHGADEEDQARSEQTMRRVNAAYQELRSRLTA